MRASTGTIVIATLVVVVASGVSMRLLDGDEYPSLGDEGLAFLAIVTAAITSSFVARASREHEASQAEEEVSDQQGSKRASIGSTESSTTWPQHSIEPTTPERDRDGRLRQGPVPRHTFAA